MQLELRLGISADGCGRDPHLPYLRAAFTTATKQPSNQQQQTLDNKKQNLFAPHPLLPSSSIHKQAPSFPAATHLPSPASHRLYLPSQSTMADSAMNDADAQNQTPVSPQPAQGANDTPMEEGTGSAEDFPSLEQVST